MLASPTRPFTAVAFLFLGGFAFSGNADAAHLEVNIRSGIYQGMWHGDHVKFIVEKMSRNGTFSGIVHFDKTSNWPDAKFDFIGQFDRGDSLTIRRVNDNCDQVARTRALRREGGEWVWKGEVTGGGLDRAYPFELRIPR